MAAKGSAWWQNFDDFRPLFDTLDPRDNRDQARYVVKKLNLKRGSRFLDCPCGIGRIALPMAKRGIRVTGVDITTSYLEELKRKAEHLKLKIELHHLDMRRIDFKNQFDAAGNLGSSLGYSDKESDDLIVIRRIYRALKPGGKFMLNLTNRDWILTNFTSRDWCQAGNVKILQERNFDYRTSKIIANWHFLRDGVESSYQVIVRTYAYHELVRILEMTGFVDIQGFGTTKDDPISRDHRMMFIIGTKPKKR
jgi:ubiquinone/menaquinone biosynthesis C-methylase UbiE